MIDKFDIIAEQGLSTVMTSYQITPRNGDMYQSEEALEKRLIKQLGEQGYTYLPIHDEAELIDNLRHQLGLLNGIEFSDAEWKQVLNKITADNLQIEDKAALIQNENIFDIMLDNGTMRNIMLLNKERGSLLKNSLQVINQYVPDGGNYANRYDVTILVNGLPLVHIELKKRGGSIKEAFNQINRYGRDSFWSGNGLFEFVQVFVISNGSQTKYYSNTTRYAHVQDQLRQQTKKVKKDSNSFEFTSYWADGNNQIIADLEDFTKTFFTKNTLLNLLVNYCVFTSDKSLMVMRPYQIAATERILMRIRQALANKWQGSIKAGGYIWHTTGSGKTLTSFKTAQLATQIADIKKVIFVVDRQDLDYQTMKEYDNFCKGAANSNTSSEILRKQLNSTDDDSKIIITTIQKLSNLLRNDKQVNVLNDNVVIIFDECHRSQFGEMHALIIKKFKKYLLFGFTGTPIFAENASGNRLAKWSTTAQIFGGETGEDGKPTKPLHTYTIIDAIRDKNVLKFNVDYVSTMRMKTGVKNEQVWGIDTEEALHAPERITSVVTYILSHYDKMTKRQGEVFGMSKIVNVKEVIKKGKEAIEQRQKILTRGFNSIFAVDSVEMAIRYYEEFKHQQESLPQSQQLKVATIFTFAANEEENELGIFEDENPEDTSKMNSSSRDALQKAIDDYNQLFGTSYDTSSEKFQNYYKDVSLRMKNKEIDILIVVGMFLTGFDAKTLNTLWVDKNLKLHGLIQAYSRTNRILNAVKNCGNIINFRNLVQKTDEALALFGDKDASGIVLMRPFTDYYNGYTDENGKEQPGYKELCDYLLKEYPTCALSMIVGENLKRTFVKKFSIVLRYYNFLTSFDEFDEKARIMSSGQMQDYMSWYNDLHEEFKPNKHDTTNVNNDLEFEMELVKQIQVDIDYILALIKQYHDSNCQDHEIRIKITKAIDSSPDLRDKKELIEKFIDQMTPESNGDVKEWEDYVEQEKQQELATIIQEENLDKEKTLAYMQRAFEDGYLTTTGLSIVRILPPAPLFGAQGVERNRKKQHVIERLQAFFQKFVNLLS